VGTQRKRDRFRRHRRVIIFVYRSCFEFVQSMKKNLFVNHLW
jgi:hypothetical protein